MTYAIKSDKKLKVGGTNGRRAGSKYQLNHLKSHTLYLRVETQPQKIYMSEIPKKGGAGSP